MAAGRIGIFWFIDGEVQGRARPVAQGETHVAGIYDSPDTHAQFWEENLKGLDLAIHREPYFAFPRGRVVYRVTDHCYVVHMDRVLFTPLAKTAIAAFFTLAQSKVLWRRDSHYTTDPGEVDQLFSE